MSHVYSILGSVATAWIKRISYVRSCFYQDLCTWNVAELGMLGCLKCHARGPWKNFRIHSSNARLRHDYNKLSCNMYVKTAKRGPKTHPSFRTNQRHERNRIAKTKTNSKNWRSKASACFKRHMPSVISHSNSKCPNTCATPTLHTRCANEALYT